MAALSQSLHSHCNFAGDQPLRQRKWRVTPSHEAALARCFRACNPWSVPMLERPIAAPHSRSRRCVTAWASMLPVAAIALAQQAAPAVPAHLPAVLSSAGVLILCCAAAAVLLAAIPLLWSMARAANRMESMLQTLEMELPDTAASLRLSSLELSDCMAELGALGNDVSSGVRAASRLVSDTEAGIKQGVAFVGAAVVPELARRETRVRDVLEAALKTRAALAPHIPQARAAVAATTATARKLRGAVMLSRVAAGVFDLGRAVKMQLTVAAARQLLQQNAAAAAAHQKQRAGQQ